MRFVLEADSTRKMEKQRPEARFPAILFLSFDLLSSFVCVLRVCVIFFSFSLTLSLFFVVSLFYSFFFFFSFSSSFLISWSGILSTIRFRKKKNQQSPNLILLISWSARSAPDSLTPPGGPCDPGNSLGFSSPPYADRDPWDRYPRARSWRPSPETIDCNVDV